MYRIVSYCFVPLIFLCSCSGVTKFEEKEIYILEKILEIDGNNNPFFTPTGFEIDENGNYIILDNISSKIFIFDNKGELVSEFGGRGEAPGEFFGLHLKFDRDTAGFFYFIDRLNKIVIFDPEMEYFRTFIVPGGVVFDVAALDTSHIYVNQALSMTKESDNFIFLFNSRGEVVDKFGAIDIELKEMDLWKANIYRSCALELDDEGFIYYTSTADYQIYKCDAQGNIVYSVEKSIPYEVFFGEDHTTKPLVWDMQIRNGNIYVLWAQGGEEKGHRVDVFDKDEGLFLGCFYTGIPSDEITPFFDVIDDSIFVTGSLDSCKLFKFRMIQK